MCKLRVRNWPHRYRRQWCAVLQKERHEEMLRSTLVLVKAIAAIPQSLTMVPEFKKFLDKTMANNDLLHVYEKID